MDRTGDDETPPRGDLDPADWSGFRRTAHEMLDGMIDYLESLRERPVWQPIPDTVKAALTAPLDAEPTPLEALHADFARHVRPYALGNQHPAFFGWVNGAATPTGMVAEMLAAGLNANVGGREHAPVYVERQVIGWMRSLFGFPETASGLLVTGTSMANLVAVLVARRAALGPAVRTAGLGTGGAALTAYTSAAAHKSVARAMDVAGLGTNALRRIALDDAGRMDTAALAAAIAADRRAGLRPFLVVGTAGSVDIGAIDDLSALADLSAAEGLWLHVDGAFGALAMLSPRLRPLLAGIERAQSLAFDFHKWGQVPYDAGCVLVRDGALHRATFAMDVAYLAPAQTGAAAGAPWFTDFGPDLSRGFRALKVWFTLREQGTRRLAAAIERNCDQARHLADLVARHGDLQLLAPVALNIVCFRYVRPGLGEGELDQLNADIVTALHLEGTAVPSTTRLGGRLAIRVCSVNHRGDRPWVERLVDRVREIGAARAAIGQ